jgi:hypothetical protein
MLVDEQAFQVVGSLNRTTRPVAIEPKVAANPGMPHFNGKEELRMGPHTIQAIAGAFAVAVLGIIVYRRKQKNA